MPDIATHCIAKPAMHSYIHMPAIPFAVASVMTLFVILFSYNTFVIGEAPTTTYLRFSGSFDADEIRRQVRVVIII